MSDSIKNNLYGAGEIALGGYLGYQGIKHGLPRALGIRTEFHTTTKNNAKLIQESGNILDPKFGGSDIGFSAKLQKGDYLVKSKNYVHITGINKDSVFYDNIKPNPSGNLKFLRAPFRTYARKCINLGYRCFCNSKNHKFGDGAPINLKTLLGKNAKTFYISGIDSYFNKNFVPDTDELFALKSSKPIKAYNNRFFSTIAGLKEFGLKGIVENKSRALFGAALVGTTLYATYKLISKGLNNLRG